MGFLMSYFVYILLCADGSFYTGYTRDISLRLALHLNGKGARYTRIHRPKKVVFTEEFFSRSEAMKREKAIKKLSHDLKQALIDSSRENFPK
jgi:putative endonuclease